MSCVTAIGPRRRSGEPNAALMIATINDVHPAVTNVRFLRPVMPRESLSYRKRHHYRRHTAVLEGKAV
jgi:hypothetical protein